MTGRRKYSAFLLLALALPAAGFETLMAAETSTADETSAAAADAAKSRWGKLLPLPIFITEPAIGEGLGASLIYFHHEEQSENPRVSTAQEIGKTAERSKPPPTATGIFGFYTNEDSAALGIGHSNSFEDDNYRLLAAAADTRINSRLYLGDLPLGFTLEGTLLYSQLKRRLGRAGAFAGLSLLYLDAETRFATAGFGLEDRDLLESGFVDAGLGLSLSYDIRDNTLLPSSGLLAEVTSWHHGDGIGGDFDYRKHKVKGLYYLGFADRYVLGLRLDASTASGGVPFFAAPYVSLRGIPALRYQGKTAGAFEIEVRRLFGERWSVALFTGSGFVEKGFEFGETEDEINNFGTGVRYLVLPQQDAWVGLDVARGPEDTAWYVQMGSSW